MRQKSLAGSDLGISIEPTGGTTETGRSTKPQRQTRGSGGLHVHRWFDGKKVEAGCAPIRGDVLSKPAESITLDYSFENPLSLIVLSEKDDHVFDVTCSPTPSIACSMSGKRPGNSIIVSAPNRPGSNSLLRKQSPGIESW